MITAETVWNNRSIKCFLLEHNTLVPLGQFNDTAVRVPKQNQLCTRRGCHCLKQHMEILDKKKILQILVEEKQEGRETTLWSVFTKDDQCKSHADYPIYHLPKSQMNFLTDFNNCRIVQTVGYLGMYL